MTVTPEGEEDDPEVRAQQQIHFLKNLGLLGDWAQPFTAFANATAMQSRIEIGDSAILTMPASRTVSTTCITEPWLALAEAETTVRSSGFFFSAWRA